VTAPPDEWRRGEYVISTDPARVDLDVTHAFLSERSYWAAGITREQLERAIANSLVFGIYRGDAQVGLARVVTDYAAFAYVADVFVLEEERGKGLSVWLMQTIVAHPHLQGLRRWMLGTRDAHGLYEKVGFRPVAAPERWMEIVSRPAP
jgi:GNAT superfamily N-acetyltransferase